MLWLKQATFANCVPFGTAAIMMSALGLGCAPLPTNMPALKPLVQKAVTAPVPLEVAALLPEVTARPIPIQPKIDCVATACLALTFDDGPDPRTTPQLLDALAAHQAKATFFMLGSQAVKHPDLVKRVVQAGHEVGNHSWIHGDFTKMTPEQMLDDITRTQDALKAAGASSVRLFRPPFGARNDTVRQTVPLSIILWNVDPKDWKPQDPVQLAAIIEASAKPGAIIVLHDIKPTTVAAAPQFIANLKQKYHLVTVSRLLGLSSETPKSEYSSLSP